jgi:acyl-CoA synthetase (AMP-forming)/AMP-acid ligase II
MIIRGPFEDVELAKGSLEAYVFANAGTWGDKPALIDGATGRAMSYRELTAQVGWAAAGLAAHGVAKGDVLALCSPNCPEFVVAYYAAASVGAVITTINPLASRDDMTRQLTHSHARWIITTPALFREKGRQAASAAGVRESFVFGRADGAAGFGSLLDASRAPAAIEVTPDNLALLPYSSGTTGLPKGVALSHRNLVASLCQARAVHQVRATDVVIAALPLFHIYGLQVTLNLALREGATVVTMPRFELEAFLRLVQDYRISRADVVPPIVLALATQPAVDGHDLSSLQVVTSGAAPLGTGLAQACARRLGCRVKQAYGLTELGGATHIAPRHRARGSRIDRAFASERRMPDRRLRQRRRCRTGRAWRAAHPDAGTDALLSRQPGGDGRDRGPGRVDAHR